MTGLVGHAALLAALAASVVTVAASVTGRVAAGRRALAAVAGLVAVATAALVWALLTGDFSFTYVADATSRAMTWPYRLGALWGGMEGSLLFWTLLLSAWAAWVAVLVGRRAPALAGGTQAVLGTAAGAFVGVVLVLADPFARLAVPGLDGGGLTPVLEHPAMLYHPPMLYLGQAGLVAPFAVTLAALAAGRLDATWLALTRRSVLVCWVLLSLGMLAGAHWAYRELGWGGFWAWDPVENGSLLPWLGATAFLHAAVVTRQRDRVRATTAGLALATFALALLGGFLTRSGATDSVHAFAEARGVGAALGGILGVAVCGSAALLAARRRALGPGWTPEGLRSKETVLLVNNTLLAATVVVVTAGTLVPVVSGWWGDGSAGVAPRFFATFTAPVAFAVLALVGIGPLLPWRGGPGGNGARRPSRRRHPPALGAAVATGGAVALGLDGPLVLAGAACAGVSAALLLPTLWHPGDLARKSVAVSHLGIVLLLFGVLGSTRGTEAAAVVGPGKSMAVGGYTLVHEGLVERSDERRQGLRVRLGVFASGRRLATLRPGLDAYQGAVAPLPETALRSTPRDDLLVTVERIDTPAGDVVVRAFVRPVVMWVWWGGLLVALGGAGALYSSGSPRAWRLRSNRRSTVPDAAPVAAG